MQSRHILAVMLVLGVLVLSTKKAVDSLTGWREKGAKYLPILYAAEDRYGIPRDLLARQAYQESRFREDIISGRTVSSAGAVGIMQIVPKWHPGVDPLNVPEAVDYAAKFLAGLKRQFGSWSLALAAYNAGPGNVTKYGGIPPFTETRNYVSQILADVNANGRNIA